MDSPQKGILYVVSTPIGNLKDITLRALEVLKEVDIVAAEDTRHSRKLFSRYDIKTRLISYYGAKEEIKGDEVLRELKAGKKVALISDAGTPGISDPGYYLIKNAAEEGYDIFTIPGPSALVSAITISGLPMARFVFEGFLPPKGSARRKRIESLKGEERAVVIYESPRRAIKTLKELLAALGDRKAVMARELTKIHEELVRGTISDIINRLEEKGVRGEITLIIAGETEPAEQEDKTARMNELINKALTNKIPVKDAAETIALELGLSKRDVYQSILKVKDKGET